MKKNLILVAALIFSQGTFAQQEINEQRSKLTDADITKILMTINDGELEAAGIADGRANRKEVKEFAKMMLGAHRDNIKETNKIVSRKRISARDNSISKAFKEEATNANKDLKAAAKESFDKAYVNQQVIMHEKALLTLNDTLIPSATDPQFKAHLEKTRDTVAAHLEHARNLITKVQ